MLQFECLRLEIDIPKTLHGEKPQVMYIMLYSLCFRELWLDIIPKL